MGCGCRRTKKEAAVVKKAELAAHPKEIRNGTRTMVKLVNFEGKMVAFNTIPQGAIFVRGVWYSSVDKMPDEIRDYYKQQLRG